MMRASHEPMTITELKHHMDRRFATKRDLRRFATKMELRREIRSVRQDFRRFAIDIKRHFDVVAKSLEEKIGKIADASGQTAQIKARVDHHGAALDDHEVRITAIERRV
jgi:hypothetical protein